MGETWVDLCKKSYKTEQERPTRYIGNSSSCQSFLYPSASTIRDRNNIIRDLILQLLREQEEDNVNKALNTPNTEQILIPPIQHSLANIPTNTEYETSSSLEEISIDETLHQPSYIPLSNPSPPEARRSSRSTRPPKKLDDYVIR